MFYHFAINLNLLELLSIFSVFAWDAYNKGIDVHVLAEPTKLELLKGEFESKKDEFKKTVQNAFLDKYGGVEHLDAPPRELIFAQTVSIFYGTFNPTPRLGKQIITQFSLFVRDILYYLLSYRKITLNIRSTEKLLKVKKSPSVNPSMKKTFTRAITWYNFYLLPILIFAILSC